MLTHLPESKFATIKCIQLLLLYCFFQVVHILILPNLNHEGIAGRAENPTDEPEFII
jgi:hypothetical protein